MKDDNDIDDEPCDVNTLSSISPTLYSGINNSSKSSSSSSSSSSNNSNNSSNNDNNKIVTVIIPSNVFGLGEIQTSNVFSGGETLNSLELNSIPTTPKWCRLHKAWKSGDTLQSRKKSKIKVHSFSLNQLSLSKVRNSYITLLITSNDNDNDSSVIVMMMIEIMIYGIKNTVG